MKAGLDTKLVGLVGLASFGCIAAGALIAPPLWDAPDTGASAQAIAAYAQDHRERLLLSLFVYGLAIALFLCFAAALAARLRSAAPRSHLWSTVFLAAAVAAAALIFAAFAPASVNAYRPQPPELALALYDMTFALLAISGFPTALLLGAFAMVVLTSRVLPPWTAWLAVLGALAHLLIAASMLFRSGFLALEGGVIVAVPATFFAWILATGAALVLCRPEPGPRPCSG